MTVMDCALSFAPPPELGGHWETSKHLWVTKALRASGMLNLAHPHWLPGAHRTRLFVALASLMSPCGLKLAMVGIFTPRKLANAIKPGLFAPQRANW